MNEPWSDGFDLSAEFLTDSAPSPSCVPSRHSWVGTRVMRDWLSGARPNYGFLFVGGEEAFPEETDGEHKTTLSDVKLELLIAVSSAP